MSTETKYYEWVKASDELPHNNWRGCVKGQLGYYDMIHRNGFWYYSNTGILCKDKDIQWLYETPSTSHTEELSTPPVREVKSAEEFHNEFIICPNCKEINHANISRSNLKNLEYGSTEPKASTLLSPSEFYKVLHTILFGTYIHDCSKCGYTIMESEWDKLPYQKELEDYLKKYYPQLCSPQFTPHKEGYSVEDMSAFGVWLNKNAYPSYDSNGKPCGWNLHKGMDGNIYSTSELIPKFLNQLKK